MQDPISLKVRGSNGPAQLIQLSKNSSFLDLVQHIQKLFSVTNGDAQRLVIKHGYPPKALDAGDATRTITALGVEDMDTLIFEIDTSKQVIQQPAESPPPPLPSAQAQAPTKAPPASDTQSQQKAPPANGKPASQSVEQEPNAEGMIMIRRVIPSDNSCLFNSIAYALCRRGGQLKPPVPPAAMRRIIADVVRNDPAQYNQAFLEKQPAQYCDWIQKETSWGGQIECHILALHYQIEIVAIDIQTLNTYRYGSDYAFPEVIYVLYSGIHYDVIVRNIFEEMEAETDIAVFTPDDDYAYNGALAVAQQLHALQEFTDTANYSLQCGVCYECFRGNAEAVEHGQRTKHMNFIEVGAKKK